MAVSVLGAAEGSGLGSGIGRRGAAQAQTATNVPVNNGGAKKQFPYYADGVWDQPKYYETIQAGRRMFPKTVQSADVDGDGRDELIARGPGGVHVNTFDHDTGQWTPLADVPGYGDRDGYEQEMHYSTVQLAHVGNPPEQPNPAPKNAALLSLGPDGIAGRRYDNVMRQWKYLADGPAWSNYFTKPEYYRTIQFVDVDNDGKAELVGRFELGIEIYSYDPLRDSWNQAIPGPDWDDYSGWKQPESYETIQFGKLFPGNYPQVIGKNAKKNLEIWNYNGPSSDWLKRSESLALPDADGWNRPECYQTIQCADIDGDGMDELLARGPGGVHVWKYDSSKQGLQLLGNTGLFADAAGSNQPQYYQTIQCADIDGDGRAELMGRTRDGLYVCKLLVGGGGVTVRRMSPITAWSDTNGWDKVQHYATITSARVLKPGDIGYTGDGTHTQAVMIGRGRLSMQTFRWISDQNGWTQTSAELPTGPNDGRESKRAAAFEALSFDLASTANIRTLYNTYKAEDTVNSFSSWLRSLYEASPSPPIIDYDQSVYPVPLRKLPFQADFEQQDWEWAHWQIFWELNWVISVNDWYKNKLGTLLTVEAITKNLILEKVGDYVSIPSGSGVVTIIFTVLGLVASAAAALLTGGASLIGEAAGAAAIVAADAAEEAEAAAKTASDELQKLQALFDNNYYNQDDLEEVQHLEDLAEEAAETAVKAEGANAAAQATALAAVGSLGVASAFAGTLSSSFDAVPSLLPSSGDSFTDAYSKLKTDVGDAFLRAAQANNIDLFALTGGTDNAQSGLYVPADYGRLKLIGQWILRGFWQWDNDSDGGTDSELLLTALRGYATYAWQRLMAAAPPWYVAYNQNQDLPSYYPPKYALNYYDFDTKSERLYYLAGSGFVPVTSLEAIFGVPVMGDPFPLGVPLRDLYLGLHGWPDLHVTEYGSALPVSPGQASEGVDIRSEVALSRDPKTQAITVIVTMENKGATPASNVEITSATLNKRSANTIHAARQKRLTYGHFESITIQFPALTGQTGALQVRGSYQGGTFGASFRVPMP